MRKAFCDGMVFAPAGKRLGHFGPALATGEGMEGETRLKALGVADLP
jgi:hypothetical protein